MICTEIQVLWIWKLGVGILKKLLLLFILFIFCYSEESGRLMENVTVDYAGNPTTNQCEKNF